MITPPSRPPLTHSSANLGTGHAGLPAGAAAPTPPTAGSQAQAQPSGAAVQLPPVRPGLNGHKPSVQWETGFQYAGPIPGGANVPAHPGQFDTANPLSHDMPGPPVLKQGSAMPVDRLPDAPPPPKRSLLSRLPGMGRRQEQAPASQQGSPSRRQFESLDHYSKNHPMEFNGIDRVPTQPDGVHMADPSDQRSMRNFRTSINNNDPSGSRRAAGEYGAIWHPDRAKDSFGYAHGRAYPMSGDRIPGASHVMHSHPHDPNRPMPPEGEIRSNAQGSRFPSTGDYLAASQIGMLAENAGAKPPVSMMMNEGKFRIYSGDRIGFKTVEERPPVP